MINTPTVLVLGAGASMPFGFPSGENLHKLICEGLIEQCSQFKALNEWGRSRSEIQNFREALFYSGTYSVDSFLEHRSEFVDIGKIAIAQALMPYEYTEYLFSHNQQNWYKYLWNVLYDSWDEFDHNNISIITFNYDRSVEQFLFTALSNRSGKSEKECADKLKTIPIIHLHGKLGDLPWQNAGTGIPYNHQQTMGTIASASKLIKIIFENTDQDIEFQQAYDLFKRATNIYFLGFGYNETNLERLKIKSFAVDKNVKGTSKDLTSRQRDLAKAHSINLVKNHDIYTFMRSHF